jgi:hypothetical protein
MYSAEQWRIQANALLFDTDVYARILDRSGEPVLQNRTRVGSIGDVEPGSQSLPSDLLFRTGTPGPFDVKNPRARGFNAPVRSRANDDDELLPLEQNVVTGSAGLKMSSPIKSGFTLLGLIAFMLLISMNPRAVNRRRTSPFAQRQSNDAPQQHATAQGPADTRLIDKLFECTQYSLNQRSGDVK